jgi:hypothetical protein
LVVAGRAFISEWRDAPGAWWLWWLPAHGEPVAWIVRDWADIDTGADALGFPPDIIRYAGSTLIEMMRLRGAPPAAPPVEYGGDYGIRSAEPIDQVDLEAVSGAQAAVGRTRKPASTVTAQAPAQVTI